MRAWGNSHSLFSLEMEFPIKGIPHTHCTACQAVPIHSHIKMCNSYIRWSTLQNILVSQYWLLIYEMPAFVFVSFLLARVYVTSVKPLSPNNKKLIFHSQWKSWYFKIVSTFKCVLTTFLAINVHFIFIILNLWISVMFSLSVILEIFFLRLSIVVAMDAVILDTMYCSFMLF